MKKYLLSLLIWLSLLPVFAGAGNPLKGTKGIVNPAAVQRALMQQAAAPVQALRIANIPGKPLVRIGGQPLSACKARLVTPKKVYRLFFPQSAIEGSFSAGKMFVPYGLLGDQKAVYRGMSLEFTELKNLLINGLETKRTRVCRCIYTAFDPVVAMAYANPAVRAKQDSFPVLVKIPFISPLQTYAQNMAQDIKLGNIVFDRDLPARFISDVWVFLEVNDQPDWYKAILQEDELVLLPANGELRHITEGSTEPK